MKDEAQHLILDTEQPVSDVQNGTQFRIFEIGQIISYDEKSIIISDSSSRTHNENTLYYIQNEKFKRIADGDISTDTANGPIRCMRNGYCPEPFFGRYEYSCYLYSEGNKIGHDSLVTLPDGRQYPFEITRNKAYFRKRIAHRPEHRHRCPT